MQYKIIALSDLIAHDRRWSEVFLRQAVIAEERYNFWKNLGQSYLAACLDNARNAYLESAIFYESRMRQSEGDVALLGKSM